jgi:hypothetical protein
MSYCARDHINGQIGQGVPTAGKGDIMRKLTMNLDAVVVIGLMLVASLGMNAWQRVQLNDLMSQYVDGQWEAQDVKANLVYARTLLKECDPVKYADLEARP